MDIELKLTTDEVSQAGPVEPLCLEPHVSIRETLRRMKERRMGSVLVCRNGVLAGIFTERDALRILAAHENLDAPIESVMIRDPVSIKADATVATAVLRMSSGGYRRLPIVDADGRPTGLIEVAGIMHYLVEHFPKTVYNLPPTPHPVSHEREGP